MNNNVKRFFAVSLSILMLAAIMIFPAYAAGCNDAESVLCNGNSSCPTVDINKILTDLKNNGSPDSGSCPDISDILNKIYGCNRTCDSCGNCANCNNCQSCDTADCQNCNTCKNAAQTQTDSNCTTCNNTAETVQKAVKGCITYKGNTEAAEDTQTVGNSCNKDITVIVEEAKNACQNSDLIDALKKELNGNSPSCNNNGTEATKETAEPQAPAKENPPAEQTAPAEQKENTQNNGTTANTSVSDMEKEVVRLVNEIRASYGLNELTLNENLSAVARTKAQDMSKNNYFSHTSPTYGTPFDMMKSFGITYNTAGENIAMGYKTAQAVVDGWMNSEGHRANILNSNFTGIGVGYEADGNYWSQMFIG